MQSKIKNMQKTSTHTLIVRGVSKSAKNKLKKIARDKRGGSVNSEVLNAIDYYLSNPISIEKEYKNPTTKNLHNHPPLPV